MPRALRFFAALVVFASACASQSTAGSPERVARNPDIISTEELQDPAIVGGNAQYAIQQLRPAFFRTRGPQTIRGGTDAATAPGALKISQDFGPLQPSSMLSSIAVRSLVEIRYLNAVDAQSRFGINANGGPVVILLSTKQ